MLRSSGRKYHAELSAAASHSVLAQGPHLNATWGCPVQKYESGKILNLVSIFHV